MKGEGMEAREALHNAYHESKDAGAASVADLTAGMIRSLAEQGYVLVNVEGLAVALRKADVADRDWQILKYFEGYAAEEARAIFAYLKDDAHPA